jgi:Tol biopolymer transport system component
MRSRFIQVLGQTAALLVLTCVARSSQARLLDVSPDGRQIAYSWVGNLIVSGIDGAGAQPIPGGEGVQFVLWSPNGRHLALGASSSGKSELKLYNMAERKTRGIGGNLRAPFAWREDGNRFACIHDLPNGSSEIVWYNLAENGVSFRATLPLAVNASSPMVWLPNTDDLALVAADHNVYTVEAGEFKKVTTSNDVLGLSLFSHGKKLIWGRKGPNLKYILLTLYAYDLTARNVVRLNFPERVMALNPDPRTAPESVDEVLFSPDGSRLLLFVSQAPAGKPRYSALYSVSMDGQQTKSIQRTMVAGESIDANWFKNGTGIGVLYRKGQGSKLFSTAPDGSSGRVIRADVSL